MAEQEPKVVEPIVEPVVEPPVPGAAQPEPTPIGDPIPPEPILTPEEENVQLRTENARLSTESSGRLDNIIGLRSKLRTQPAIRQPVEDPYKGREDDEPFTVGDARKASMDIDQKVSAAKSEARMDLSVEIAEEKHKDFAAALATFEDMADRNPALWGVAYGSKNPGEYIYKEGGGTTSPETIKREAKKEVVDTITSARPVLPKGGGGGPLGGPITAEQVAKFSPGELQEFKKENPKDFNRIMRETGEAE